MIKRFSISGMTCASCVKTIEKALSQATGVIEASVNLVERTALVKGSASSQDLIQAISQAGYVAREILLEVSFLEKEFMERLHDKKLFLKGAVAGVLGSFLLVLDLFDILPFLDDKQSQIFWVIIGFLTLGVLIFSGSHFFKGAFHGLRKVSSSMDTLIALGTASAWVYSMILSFWPSMVPFLQRHTYFEAACVILAFINIGLALEARARRKTSRAIGELLGLQPRTARVVRNFVTSEISISEIVEGDVIHIRPGDKIPVDGAIIEGYSFIDESMLTGEALPVEKKLKNMVIGGTLNKSGSFLFKATKVGKDTVLSHIVAMVRQAQNSKPKIGKLVDKIASIFVPIVLVISGMTFFIWYTEGPEPQISFAFVTMMTVLIIACPCALGLATPISIMIGVGRSAREGILIRDASALELSGKLTTLVLDKTGTLTEGEPQVVFVITDENMSQEKILQWAASLEHHSNHPLGQAIVQEAKKKKIERVTVQNFHFESGQGLKGIIEGKNVLLGNQLFMQNNDIDLLDFSQKLNQWTVQGQTPVYVAAEQKAMGVILIHDPIKKDSKEAIEKLHGAGLNIVMLTGDNVSTAQAIARQLNIDKVFAQVLPDEKAQKIKELQEKGEIVGMVGDGINDAPSLTQAHVGFAIGTGTDVAIESADVVLMGKSLLGIAHAITLSQATIKNIKQNLFGAFIYNILAIPIAAGVLYPLTGLLLNPMIAGLTMALSSLTVVANANRLYFKSLSASSQQ